MAWSRTKILTALGEIISLLEGLPARDVGRGTSFVDDLGIGPMRLVDLVVEAEVRFDVTVPDEEIDNLATVGDFADYIFEHQALIPG